MSLILNDFQYIAENQFLLFIKGTKFRHFMTDLNKLNKNKWSEMFSTVFASRSVEPEGSQPFLLTASYKIAHYH